MSQAYLYTCDCCGFQSVTGTDFNNAPRNMLLNSWNPDSMGGTYADTKRHHYCRACIDKLNEAIDAVFAIRKPLP